LEQSGLNRDAGEIIIQNYVKTLMNTEYECHISPEVISIAWSACVLHSSVYSHFSVLSHFLVQFDSFSQSSGNLSSGGKTGGILGRGGDVFLE